GRSPVRCIRGRGGAASTDRDWDGAGDDRRSAFAPAERFGTDPAGPPPLPGLFSGRLSLFFNVLFRLFWSFAANSTRPPVGKALSPALFLLTPSGRQIIGRRSAWISKARSGFRHPATRSGKP